MNGPLKARMVVANRSLSLYVQGRAIYKVDAIVAVRTVPQVRAERYAYPPLGPVSLRSYPRGRGAERYNLPQRVPADPGF